MSKQCKHGHEINSGHYLEMLDRLHVAMANIDDHIRTHPVSCVNADIHKLVVQAQNKLMEAYQMVGGIEYQDQE